MLARELGTHTLNGLHHDGLELIRDLRHEAGDLLHKTLHTGLTTSLDEWVGASGRGRSWWEEGGANWRNQ